MNRFASPLLRVIFDGADPHEESLYHTFRVFSPSFHVNTSLIALISRMVASSTLHPLPLLLAPLTAVRLSPSQTFAHLSLLAMLHTASTSVKRGFVLPLFLQYKLTSFATGFPSTLVLSFQLLYSS